MVGGHGGADGAKPEVFERLANTDASQFDYSGGNGGFSGDNENRSWKKEVSENTKGDLGEIAKIAEGLGSPETPRTFRAETDENTPTIEMMGEAVADFPGETELRPLADDGSTERKIDKKKILTFDGDIIDKESQKEVEKAIKEYANDPFELDNLRNQMMADGLRDNYGRIFGNGGED